MLWTGVVGRLAPEQLALLLELSLVDLAPGESLLDNVNRRAPGPAISGANMTASWAMAATAEEAYQDHNDGHETDQRQQHREGRKEHSGMRPVPVAAGAWVLREGRQRHEGEGGHR